MTTSNAPRSHDLVLDTVLDPDSVVPAGAVLRVTARVSCSDGCDLRGSTVTIFCGEAVLGLRELGDSNDDTGASAEVQIAAPLALGGHDLQLRVDPHDGTHEPVVAVLPLTTLPHESTLAVWDVPFPIVEGSTFGLKVGAACACRCPLSGRTIEIRDQAGELRGRAQLSESAWPDTAALYWAAVSLIAPGDEALCSWQVTLPADVSEPVHRPAAATFTFAISPPPDCRVHVRLTERETGAAINDAELRLGRYEVFTDESGEGRLDVPAGTYPVLVRKDGAKAPPTTVTVREDMVLELAVDRVRTHAELENMMKRFEGDYWRP